MKKKAKKPALGRGLGTILGGSSTSASGLQREEPLTALTPGPWQPRQRMNAAALGELAQTIAARGVLQPIIVRPSGKGSKAAFEIIAGERRWRASKLAGLRTVPVVVREFSDRDALLAALIENIQREDLSVLEQATAAQRIVDELKLPLKEAAVALGMSRPALSNLLRLLKLAAPVRQLLADEALSAGHARVIAGLPASAQLSASKAVIARNLTVRQTEALGKLLQQPKQRAPKKKTKVDADTARLCDELATQLGMRVEITPRGQRGRLTVHYRSLDSLDTLLRKLRR